MNIRQLQALRAVVESQTTTQAAEILGVTQPAISTLIAGLEKSLNIKLFERSRGRLWPTPEAFRLADEADKVIAGFGRMEQRARKLNELKSGELRVASLPGPGLQFIPRLLAQFLADKPEVTVHLQVRSSSEIKEWVASQYLDLGLADLPIDNPAIHYEIVTMRCVCVVPAGHFLAGKPLLTPKDLDNVPFIVLEPGHMTHTRLAAAFLDCDARLNVRVSVQLFAPACELVANGAGVSLVDPITAQAHKPDRLVSIPFEPVIPFSIALMTPIGKPLSLLTQRFLESLKKGFAPYII